MSQLCDFCGHAIDHETWCAKHLARAAVTLDEALPIARDAAERFPQSYSEAPPFYPHAWVLEAVSVALVQRNRERIRAEEADARSKVHSKNIADLIARCALWSEMASTGLPATEAIGTPTELAERLATLLTNSDTLCADLRERLGRLTRSAAAAVDVMNGRPVSTTDGSVGGALLSDVRHLRADRDNFAARCETAERENERLTADVAQLRATTAADGEQIAYLSKEREFVAALQNDRASVLVDLRKQLAAVSESADGARQALNAIGDMVPNRESGYPAIVGAVRYLVDDHDRLEREVKEMGEEMARDVEPQDVLTAASELAKHGGRHFAVRCVDPDCGWEGDIDDADPPLGMTNDPKCAQCGGDVVEKVCPRCTATGNSIALCEHCGICNTCTNADPDVCDCDAHPIEPDWQSIAHRLFAGACPGLAPAADLAAEPDRWISEVVSARRVKEIAHADNAKLVQQAQELAARLDEIRRNRGDVVNSYSAIDGTAMVDGTPPLRAAIVERVAQLIAAKVGA